MTSSGHSPHRELTNERLQAIGLSEGQLAAYGMAEHVLDDRFHARGDEPLPREKSIAYVAVDLARMLDSLEEQLQAAEKALETPRQYDVLLSDMKEQFDALRSACERAWSYGSTTLKSEDYYAIQRILDGDDSIPASNRDAYGRLPSHPDYGSTAIVAETRDPASRQDG